MGVVIKHRGNFNNFEKFAKNYDRKKIIRGLNALGKAGVSALAAATPIDSGITANSWFCDVWDRNDAFGISWANSNTVDGVPIVILIQYGHVTINGGYVPGRDFINPAIQPIIDQLVNLTWREVTRI